MSDWKQGAAERRDRRNTKSPETARSQTGPRKDRKKWCRGKVGVEHEPKCMKYAPTKRTENDRFTYGEEWRILVCQRCGKELAAWFPFGSNRRNKPDWVTL